MYICIYIAYIIYIRATPSVEGSNSQSNVVATLHSIGKINKGIREYSNPAPVKLYIQLGRSTEAFGNMKICIQLMMMMMRMMTTRMMMMMMTMTMMMITMMMVRCPPSLRFGAKSRHLPCIEKNIYIILKYICIYLIIIRQCVKTLYPW